MLFSSIHAAETIDECRPYDGKLRSYVQIQRPEVVKEYNHNMGDVDLTDKVAVRATLSVRRPPYRDRIPRPATATVT